LDFNERPQWDDMVRNYGLAAAPLQLHTAEALNQAYTTVQTVEQLLRRHRLLALSRAPIPTRLSVMRQLAKLDAGNPIWWEDLQKFERALARQMESRVEHAIDDHDAGALRSLRNEIQGIEWLSGAEAPLVARVEGATKQREKTHAREALEVLASEL